MRKIPKKTWLDNTETYEELIFRLSLVLDVPFERFQCEIGIEDDDVKILPKDGHEPITLWEIKQRAFVSGQKLINDRIHTRDAVLSALGFVYTDEKEKQDTFRDNQLSIGYSEHRPLLEYAKQRRKIVKKRF